MKVFRFLLLVFFLTSCFKTVLFAQSENYYIIARISLEGNRKTKDNIILRELSFKSSDTIAKSDFIKVLERSKSNLVNTLLFNYVEIIPLPIDSTYTDILIQVKERFYLLPIPVFQFADPNFNTWWINKDFSRANYGLVILKRNFRGRNEDIGAKAQLGYSKEFAFMYRLPYLNKKQNVGAGVWASYVQNNEITVGTINNKRVFYIGNNGNSRDELTFRINSTIRKKLYNTHFTELRFYRNRIVEEVAALNNNYFKNNAHQMKYFSFHYTFKHDRRDNKGYPLEGTLFQMDAFKHGLGILDENAPNIFYLVASHSEFFKLNNRFYFAAQLKGKYTLAKDLPYFFQEGLGYQNFIRGYEYYVIDGQHFGLFKSNFKTRLFGPKIKEMNVLQKTNYAKLHYAFYFNFYLDAGYVIDRKYAFFNPLSNKIIYGTGLGLDFVMQYDKVVRFEYSLNKELEHGFFLHFMKPF